MPSLSYKRMNTVYAYILPRLLCNVSTYYTVCLHRHSDLSSHPPLLPQEHRYYGHLVPEVAWRRPDDEWKKLAHVCIPGTLRHVHCTKVIEAVQYVITEKNMKVCIVYSIQMVRQ